MTWKITATIEGPEKPTRTLADLENGVAARVQYGSLTVIRYRHGDKVYGPLNEHYGPIFIMGGPPSEYEVLEVLGKFTVKFEQE